LYCDKSLKGQSVYPAMVVAAQLVADGYSMCWFTVFVLKQPSLFKSHVANRGIALEDPCRLSDPHLSAGINKRAIQSLGSLVYLNSSLFPLLLHLVHCSIFISQNRLISSQAKNAKCLLSITATKSLVATEAYGGGEFNLEFYWPIYSSRKWFVP
jgi:hypothetical protein